MVVIKGRRPPLGGDNEGYDTDYDSDDEGTARNSIAEESKVCAGNLCLLNLDPLACVEDRLTHLND